MAGSHAMLKNNRLHYLTIFCITFAVYYWSTSRTVVLEDDGFFIMAAYFNGIAHPPGYPLFTVIAHIISCIPFGSVAFRLHLLSGVFASFSCIILWVIACKLFEDRICAYAAALSLAFSNIFWSQAIITEVYTLNAMLVLIILLLVLVSTTTHDTGLRNSYFRWTLLTYGLALSNHWPLLILTTPMFIAVIWPVRREFIQSGIKGAGLVFLGLLPYAWMVIRSNMHPEISFYGPIRNLYDFWFYLSRQGYHDVDTNAGAGWYDRLMLCGYFFQETFRQFGPVGFCLLVTGFFYQWKILKKHLCTGLILGYLGSSVFLILLLDYDYDQLHRVTFRVYPVISYVIASLWTGIGLLAVCRSLQLLPHLKNRIKVTQILLLLLTTTSTFAGNAPENYRAEDTWAETYAKVILDSLPENSVLFLDSDVNVGPVGYMNLVAGYRKDIKLYNTRGTVFSDRIFRPFKATYRDVKHKIDEFIKNTKRPLYYTNNLPQDYGTEYYGLYWKVLKDQPKDYGRVMLNPLIVSYLQLLHRTGLPWDEMEKIHYYSIMSEGCRVLTLFQTRSGINRSPDTGDFGKLADDICDTLVGIYFKVDILLGQKQPDYIKIGKLLDRAEGYLDESSLKAETAYLDYYRGILSIHESRKDLSEKYFRESVRIWDHPDNPAREELSKLNEPGSTR